MESDKNWKGLYLRLNKYAALKRLEDHYVYHIGRDELYEIDEKTESFLAGCNGTGKGAELTDDSEFVEYCLDEGILETLSVPDETSTKVDISPRPSLRYLELQLTERCNLKCGHCYLGDSGKTHMKPETAVGIAGEFSSMGGLRLLITGGEPMLYPHIFQFLRDISGLKIRRVLLTNGTLINRGNINRIDAEEIQFSLDGWKNGHDRLRGEGSFEKTVAGIEAAAAAGRQVSIATMVHGGNLDEFEAISKFAGDVGAIEWGIDIMCIAGNLKKNRDLVVPYDRAAKFMEYAYGGGYHGSSDGYACGRHLMTVLPDGTAVKCGFYGDPLGNASESLKKCWLNLEHVKLADMICGRCPSAGECCGGCRFRAPGALEADPAMCALYGIDPDKLRRYLK